MGKNAPLSSVSFSLGDVHDDHSELTGPCCCWLESEDILQQDEFGVKLASDPHYYSTLHGSHNSRTKKQDQIELKAQLVRQKDKVAALSSKLSNCEAENEALKAENAALVDKLARDHGATQEKLITKQRWSFKALNNGNGGSMQMLIDANANLMNDNARLQTLADVMRKSLKSYIKDSQRDNNNDAQMIKKLQGENAILKSLFNSIESSKASSSVHTSKTSAMCSFTEKRQDDCIINISQHWTPKPKSRRRSTGAEVSSNRSLSNKNQENLPINGSQHSGPVVRKSLGSIPEQELEILKVDDGCIKGGKGIAAHAADSIGEVPKLINEILVIDNGSVREGEGIEAPDLIREMPNLISEMPMELIERATARSRGNDIRTVPRRKSADELLFDLELLGKETAPSKGTGAKDVPRCKSEELLVDFREAIRAQRSESTERHFPLGTTIRVPVASLSKDADDADEDARSRSSTDLPDAFVQMFPRKLKGSDQRISQSLTGGRSGIRKPKGLLVDFNTAGRSKARRWSSVNF